MNKPWDEGILKVGSNKKNLINGKTPFFWLGDTAWDLFQRLSENEAYIYLKNRKEKGFNVIQSVLINFAYEADKTSYQNIENQNILNTIHSDNKEYWEHVEHIVDIAVEFGIYFALLPCWGRLVKSQYLNMDNVQVYAEFLASRFKSKKNIIWLLGGDIRGDLNFELLNAFGEILKKSMPDKLIGYHPFGRTSSSYWFSNCDWLDFNMFQSGHRRYDQNTLKSWDDASASEPWFGEDNWRYVASDRLKEPLKPVIDGEPSYEQIPQGLHNPAEPYWQAHQVRRYAYWSVLSGSMGHTYGHNAIFQFYGTGYTPEFGVNQTWQQAIHSSGGSQMQYLKNLMLEIDFANCDTMQYILTPKETGGEKEKKIVAFGNSKNIVIYNYCGHRFGVKLPEKLDGIYSAYWIDPVNGTRSYFGDFRLQTETVFMPPPKDSDFTDWLLLLTNLQ